jgi:zinc transporter ZupT
MSISRNLGILVVFGVPAIVGGGLAYYFFQSYTPLIVYEIILGFAALGFIKH